MKFDLRKPCDNCPFRTDVPVYLRLGRVEEITDVLVSGGTFACHKTTESDPDDTGERYETPDSQHCAGALIMLERLERPNQMMRIMERLRLYDRRKLDMDAPVYSSSDDMIEAAGGSLK